MYIYDGFKYSEEEIKNAADKAGLSIEDYTSKNEITFEDEAQDFPTSTPADADAVQQPMTASQAGFTESPSVDTPSESLDPDPIVKNNTLNTFVEIKPTEKNEDDDDQFTFENKKVNTNDLEKVGFEITEERSMSNQRLGAIDRLTITAPNGETGVFNKKGDTNNINNFLKNNSADVASFKANKSNRIRFKDEIKSLYKINFRNIPAGELINNEDEYNSLKELAVKEYNNLNRSSAEEGNVFGFGGKTALEAQMMSEYQVDKIMKEAVNEMYIAEEKENEDLSNELLAKQIEETGMAPLDFLKKETTIAGKEILDPNIREATSIGRKINELNSQALNIDPYSIESLNFNKTIDSLKRKQNQFVKNYTGNEAKYFLDFNNQSVEYNKLENEDEGNLDITNKVVPVMQKILAMKASKGSSAVGIDFLKHRSEGRSLMDELNKRIDVSTKKRGGKMTISEGFDRGSWQGALSQKMLRKNAEEGVIKAQQFDNFKNIKVKDLVDMYITSKGFMREGFGDNLQGVPAGYTPTEGKDSMTQAYDSDSIKDLADRYLNYLAEKKAYEVGYLANIDPASIKRTGFFGAFGTSVAESFTSPEQVEKTFGPTNSEMLSKIENIAVANNIELSTEQKNNFKETLGEFTGTAIGQAPKLALEFGVANAVTGGVLGVTGLGRYLAALKTGKYFKNGKQISNKEVANLANEAGYGLKNGKAASVTSNTVKKFLKSKKASGLTKKGGGILDQATALGAESLIEGVKMEQLFEDGFNTGLMFIPASRAVGALFKAVPKFNFIKGSTYHRLNELAFKPAKSGLSLIPASEAAGVGEAVIDDFMGRKDFKTFIDENFSDAPGFGEGGINRRLLGHFITGSALGYAHVNWNNVKSTTNGAKNMNAEALKNLYSLVEANGSPESAKKRLIELRESIVLSEPEQKELEDKVKYLEDFSKNQALYKMSQDYLDAGTSAMAETDPTIRAREAELEIQQAKKDYKKTHGENLKLDLKLAVNGEGLDGKSAEYTKLADGKYKITIDQRKYKKGLIPHELGHMYSDIYKINDSKGMGEIKNFLESTVKEQLGQDIFRTIKEEYSTKTKQTEESFNEEYVMALVQKLGEGNSNLIRSNSFGKIKIQLQNLFNKRIAKVKGEPAKLDINTPEQLLNVLSSIASGKNVAAKYKELSGLIINGNKVFKNTGEVVGVIGGLENSNRTNALLNRQSVLSAKEKRTEAEEKEYQQNIVEIQEGVGKMAGKKASVELDEFTKELEDKLWDGEIDEYEMQAQLSNFKAKQTRKSKETTKPKKVVDLDDVIVSDTKLDELALKYQLTPEDVSRKEKEDLENQYTKLAINSLQRWAYSGGRKVPIKEAMKDPEIKQEIIQEIAMEFNSVMKNYKAVNPETGVAQKLSTYIGNTVARRVGPKVVERYARNLQNVSMSSGVGESFTSSESADQYVQEGEDTGIKRKIDPLKFDVASQKTMALNEAVFPELVELQRIENKTAADEAKIEETKTNIKETITPDYIQSEIAPKVGEVLFDIDAKKLTEANVAITYAEPIVDGIKQLSEAKKIQTYFSKGQNAKNYIKILPEFNVARTEAETSNPLETILVDPEIKGRSVLKANNLKKYFYEKYVDPRSKTDKERAVTDPSGRSKGKKVQTGVVRLKPQFRGEISPETVQDFLTEMGITPSGEMNIPPSKRVNGKDLRSVLGRFLLGNAKLLSNLTANKIARQKIEGFETSIPKEIDQILANIKSGTSPNMASLELNPFIKKFVESQGYRDYKQYVAADQEIKTIKSEVAKNLTDIDYLEKLNELHGIEINSKDLLEPMADSSSGIQNFSYKELVRFGAQKRKFAEFLPKEFSQIRGLSGYILGRQYRNDLTGFKSLGKEGAIKKVVNEKGEEMFIDQLQDIILPTAELNKLLDVDVSSNKYSFETKKLSTELNEILKGRTLESITSQRAKTLKTNLKKAQKNKSKQAEIIKAAVNDKANNKARNIALNLLNSLKVDYVKSTEKGSKERKEALTYMTRLAISTSNIHYGEKSLVEIVGGVTGKGEFYLEHLDTATKTGLRGLDNIYFGTNNKLQSRAMLVPKTFAARMDKKVSKTSMNGMLRLLPFAKTNNILIKNNKGKVVKFKEYLKNPETWTINDLKAHAQEVKEAENTERASLDLSKTFNKIIEGKTGIKASDVYSKSRGIKSGKGKGRLDIIPPSAEDFVGLLYKTLGKGKEGDAQMAWYKKNLIDPFARGDEAITNERNALMRDFKQVKKEIVESIGGTDFKGVSPLTKKLKATIGDQVYTGEDAVRMYIWKKQGMEIPNIDKAEVDAAVAEVAKDPMLADFANKIRTINRGRPYTAPENQWVAGNIATDFLSGINTEGRAKYLKEWQANVDEVFSKENMNKLEGAFGTNYRKAMENMLKRMRTGKNRDVNKDKLGGRVTDWINNSTGAIMFFNQRSAVLQLMSATNFVNMSDNNIFSAGKAFANQPQYWKDFKMLFNSEYLKNRRGGLEFNVTESEIADIAKQGGVSGLISKILKVGFTPTQIADSFAIAAGGSTFFRNRYKTYLKETNAEGEKVYTEKEAKEKAFLDFKETAEESQQSSRPDKISQQQASDLGRLILSFANTPSQYARIIKKATLDLKDSRGDAKSNISKIAYYSFLTNLVFNGMQKALFAEAMGDDDEEPRNAAERKAKEKRQSKYIDVANGMISSYLRGTGVRGNVLSTLKDMGLEIYKQQGKTVQDYDRVADAALGFSPPIRYKYIQMKSAGRKFTFPGSRKEVKEKLLDIDSPALMAGAQYTSALTNIPLDRALKKINNIVLASNSELEEIQRIGLILGWSTYDLNIPKKGRAKDKTSKYKTSKYKKSKYK